MNSYESRRAEENMENGRVLLISWDDRERGFVLKEGSLSDARGFQRPTKRPELRSAEDVVEQLRSSKRRSLLVDDQILCGHVSPRQAHLDERRAALLEVRRALLGTESLPLVRVTAQASEFQPLVLHDQAALFSLLEYAPTRAGPIQIGNWNVTKEDLGPAVRLDAWHHQPLFESLRRKRESWEQLSEWFSIVRTTLDAPTQDFARASSRHACINTMQFVDGLRCIDVNRIDKWMERPAEEPELEDGDLVMGLARRTDAKLARYARADVGPAITMKYVTVLRPKKRRRDADVLADWMCSAPDFRDQLRMHLSDRLYIPLSQQAFEELRLPPVHDLRSSKSSARFTRALSRVVALRSDARPAALGELMETMPEGFPAAGGRAAGSPVARARLEHVLQAAADKFQKHLVIVGTTSTDFAPVDRALPRGLKTRRILLTEAGFPPDELEVLARSRFALLLTNQSRPLRYAGEYRGFRTVLQVMADDHLFVLLPAKDDSASSYRAADLLHHVFVDDGHTARAVKLEAGETTIPALEARLGEPDLRGPRVADALFALARACRDSGDDDYAPFEEPLLRTRGELVVIRQASPGHMVVEVPKDDLVSSDEHFREALDEFRDSLIQRVETVLIEGETGVGKDHFVKTVATQLGQPEPVFVGALVANEELALTELFGHVKGAFTGADKDKEGYVGRAVRERRSLFLNEINSYGPKVQFQLLSFLQDRQYERVGESGVRQKFNQVVICATNQPLRPLVDAGRMREDLYYRLGHAIRFPPLRERRGDIERLLNRFIDRQMRETDSPRPVLQEAARRWMVDTCAWRGNVRELEMFASRLVRRASHFGRPIGVADLKGYFGLVDDQPQEDGVPARAPEELQDLERLLATGRSKRDVYRALTRNPQATNNLSTWVRRRAAGIRQYEHDLPLSMALLNGYESEATAPPNRARG